LQAIVFNSHESGWLITSKTEGEENAKQCICRREGRSRANQCVGNTKFAIRLKEMSGADTDTYVFNLMKGSDNYNSLYSLALVAAVNRYRLKVYYVEQNPPSSDTNGGSSDTNGDSSGTITVHMCDIKGLEILW
jgi:hypothetical protein